MDKTEIFTDKIQQCQSLQNMTCISMEVTFYESGSISPLFDFDGVCYFHDNFFQMFFTKKSKFIIDRIGVVSKVWFVIFAGNKGRVASITVQVFNKVIYMIMFLLVYFLILCLILFCFL